MSRISLVISDVDGTLVTTDKTLTSCSRDAVSRLNARGVAFSVVSARPPFGLSMLVEPLTLQLPMGAFNGATLAMPDMTILTQQTLPFERARDAAGILRSFGIGIWAFTGERWFIDDPKNVLVERETRTIRVDPTVVARVEDHFHGITKIVGASADHEGLSACEAEMKSWLGEGLSIVRSQSYYLDITPAGTNKGLVVVELARRLGIPLAEVATIGDMENDVAMFRKSGFSIAMGNALPEVKREADAATLSNDEDGFAAAMDDLILPRVLILSVVWIIDPTSFRR